MAALDFAQIEMVWGAELAQDASMAEVFRRGDDLHVYTAAHLFRLGYDSIRVKWKQYKAGALTGALLAEMRAFEMDMRLPSKSLGFAILYGVTPQGLQVQILAAGGPFWTLEECAAFIDSWYGLFPRVRAWLELQYSRALRYGMTWNAFGRIRLIPEARSVIRRVRQAGLRQAGNQPIQGSAGDHLKLAMAEIQEHVEYYQSEWPRETCWPLLQIHDELIFELSPAIQDDFLGAAKEIMETCVPMSMPTRSSVSTGETWADLK
jgi:DNA polymerase-1